MTRKYDVAVMHDYFVDRLVYTPSLRNLTRVIHSKAAAGGGGLHGIKQTEIRGGNAVNMAHSLARLGLRTLLITHSDPANEGLLLHTFKDLPVDLRVKPLKAGLTVAFEEKVNVMLGFSGGAGEFGPQALEKEDWRMLKSARIVCSVNWAANRRGTELLKALRRILGESKTIFFDPADFRDRLDSFRDLLRLVAKDRLVDWMSMNEQESLAASKLLNLKQGDLGETCSGLARKLGVVFDLHGMKASYSSDGFGVTIAKFPAAKSRRLTGAGDVWDAGAIYGRVRRMDEYDRLAFANAAARLYLESESPQPPTEDNVLKYIR